MNIGNSMKKVRKEKGMKQIDVAKDLATSQSYISMIENGKTVPTTRFIKLFCLQYGVDSNSLLE